jgi:glycosyltransferase involved in cell wall biosynthesis
MVASIPAPSPDWPRITLVTPVLNGARHLEAAITSVLGQGYPNLEYIIVDGGSHDGTLDLIRRQERSLAWWVSEPDRGMYDALNKGYARSSGEVMGWLSSTDLLHLGALFVVGGVFRDLREVEWLTGIPTALTEEGMTVGVGPLRRWTRPRFLLGANHYVQQESTFWRRSLWDRAGGRMDDSRTMASDFELWLRFFRHARLHPVRALVGGFRHHRDSLWLQNQSECSRLCDEALWRELDRDDTGALLRSMGRMALRLHVLPGLGSAWERVVGRLLHVLPGPDRPPVVWHDGTRWVTRSPRSRDDDRAR